MATTKSNSNLDDIGTQQIITSDKCTNSNKVTTSNDKGNDDISSNTTDTITIFG